MGHGPGVRTVAGSRRAAQRPLERPCRCAKLIPPAERTNGSALSGGFVMRRQFMVALSTAALLTTTAAFAQAPMTNLDKLGAFKTTGASPNIPTIPQTG